MSSQESTEAQRHKRKRSDLLLVTEHDEDHAGASSSRQTPVPQGEITRTPSTAKNTSLFFSSRPNHFLIIARRGDAAARALLLELGEWLEREFGGTVLLERDVWRDTGRFATFDAGAPLHEQCDVLVTLGGDGTLLHAASLFQHAHPPVYAIAMGSLGFLTPFDAATFRTDLPRILSAANVTLRSRIHCEVRRADGSIAATRQVLNEIVVDRGHSPYLSQIEVYCNNAFVTIAQADGLIVSTATGSTAYSLSAGGSILHPELSALQLTPVCAHSLSFRPVCFPDSVVLRLQIPAAYTGTARVTMDGKQGAELQSGWSVVVKHSKHPVPCLNSSPATSLWMRSLAEQLHWNSRSVQQRDPNGSDANGPSSLTPGVSMRRSSNQNLVNLGEKAMAEKAASVEKQATASTEKQPIVDSAVAQSSAPTEKN